MNSCDLFVNDCCRFRNALSEVNMLMVFTTGPVGLA